MIDAEVRRDRCSDHPGHDAAADVRRPRAVHAGRLPGGVLARRARHRLRLRRDRPRLLHHLLSAGDPGARVRQRAVERPAARGAVLHLHGRDPGTLRPGRGHARFDGPAVRTDPRRAGLLRHHRRLHPGRDHRHRRGPGHRDGADLHAGDDPLQIQHPLHDGRAGRLGHDHPARAAVARADRAGRSARQVGRRHVSRRLGTIGHPDRAVRALHVGAFDLQAGMGARGAEGGAHARPAGRCGRSA